MGWRGRGLWPGHGPFSNLPPWQRPGWLYGRGACWWLYPYYTPTGLRTPDQTHVSPGTPLTPLVPRLPKDQETQILEQQTTILQNQLDAIKNRLAELSKE